MKLTTEQVKRLNTVARERGLYLAEPTKRNYNVKIGYVKNEKEKTRLLSAIAMAEYEYEEGQSFSDGFGQQVAL